MYGLINQAIERMVCDLHGEDAWLRIKERAQVDVEMFLSMEVYPDEITYRLLEAASSVLGSTMAEVLEAFGRYWFTFTKYVGYDHLLELAGTCLSEFLENLDTLHSCLVEGFPEILAPTFTYDRVGEREFHLHYYSERPGLGPMVKGLVASLAQKFGEAVEITLIQVKDHAHDHDILRIQLLETGTPTVDDRERSP